MADAQVITKQLAAADADNIALAQAPVGAGALTLNGAAVSGGIATLDTQRRVGITSAGNDTGRTFTVKGTMQTGVAITEDVTGANAGVASTLQDFYTVTEVDTDGATAGNVSVGTTSTGSTPWIIPNWHISPIEILAGVTFLSGAATATVETTIDNPLPAIGFYTYNAVQPVPVPAAWPGLSALAANAQGVINADVGGIRLTITAGTGEVRLTLRQAGISGA